MGCDGSNPTGRVLVISVSQIVPEMTAAEKFAREFITARGRLRVNYNRSVVDLVKAGKYDWIRKGVNDTNFPSTETGIRDLDYGIFYFPELALSSSGVERELRKVDFRVATIKELLTFGEQNPKEQTKFTIVALGSKASFDRDHCFGYLCSIGAKRHLRLGDSGTFGWYNYCRFLGIRK